jgi:glutathione S-transferase
MATETETVAILRRLAAAYPNFRLEPETIAEYVMELADLDPETLWEATRLARRSSKWFPTIAEIRALHGQLCEQQRYSRRTLPEPKLPAPTEEQRSQIRALIDRLKHGMAMR